LQYGALRILVLELALKYVDGQEVQT